MLAVVTYLYPAAIKFIPDFLSSVLQQTVKDFELIVFNDGVDSASEYFDLVPFRITIVNSAASINEIRYNSFLYLRNSSYSSVLFQDIDDAMSTNRVEVVLEKLMYYSLVSNDLSTFVTSSSIPVTRKIWSNRLGNNFEFDWRFIVDKNIVGLGNTAIKKELLQADFKFNDHPLAMDWFLFYQLLFQTQAKAVFTGECETLYRQHDQNIAGAEKGMDSKQLQHCIKVKKTHYRSLKEIGMNVDELLNKVLILEQKINNLHLEIKDIKNPFWWEEVNYIL